MIDELLDFIRLNIEKVEPNKAFWKINYSQDINFEDKVYLETSVALMLYNRLSQAKSHPDSYRKIQDCIISYVERSEYALKLTQRPYLLYNYGLTYITLKKCGYKNLRLDAIFRFIEEKKLFNTIETIPFRVLDIEWAKHVLHQSEIRFDTVSKTSILNKQINPTYITSHEVYVLTHTIFYLTDFGEIPLPEEIDTVSLRETINTLISWALSQEDLDVLAELLISVYCIYDEEDSYSTCAYEVLSKYYSDLGFLPSKGFITTTYQNMGDPAEKQAYAYRHIYHTNYVWFMLLLIRDNKGLNDPNASGSGEGKNPSLPLAGSTYFLNELNFDNGIVSHVRQTNNNRILLEMLLLKSIESNETEVLQDIIGRYKDNVELHSSMFTDALNYVQLCQLQS